MIAAGLALLALGAIAALMAITTALLIRWAADALTVASAALVLFLLAMMVAMLGSALYYFLAPGPGALVRALWAASAAMSASVFPVLRAFLGDARRRAEMGPAFVPARLERRTTFAVAVLTFVVVNEFLMGWTFQLAAGTLTVGAVHSVADALAAGVNSPWFLVPMALEMGLSAFLLRGALPRSFVVLLGLQAAVMALSPPAFVALGGLTLVIAAGSGLMIALVVVLMEYLYRHRQFAPVVAAYLPALLAIYAVMMAGLYVWLVDGSGLLFAVSVLLEMILFFDAAVLPERFQAPVGAPWQLRPHWTVVLLATVFVAELFMGAVLDLALEPSTFQGLFPTLPSAGTPITLVAGGLTATFWFLADVTASTWFLVMMGLEMGALVVFRLREVRQRENRARLVLMLGCYAAFAVFFPSIYYSLAFPHAPAGVTVPFLGWSMGLGSAPIAPAVFSAILGTYVLTGALGLLFGRRAICSVFCTAPMMYQGTTINAMSGFNRTSPVARKYLGSRLSTTYRLTNGVTMVALVAVSFLSYFDQVGRLNVTILGADPSVFFFAFSFSVLWFLLFVTIPYAGNYNCVTMGWCYTGTIAAWFQRVGFFELRVRDKQVCRRCTTLDCAKKCPVGLVDMPGHFRTKGVFRSTKCCGVGNCIEACPYGNLYIRDVRHWVRDRLALHRAAPEGPLLPMVRPGPRPEVAPPNAASTAPGE
jgi:polyferredoxin